jgi:hypothetical protein
MIGGCASSIDIKERGDKFKSAPSNFCITSWGTIYVPNGQLKDYTQEPLQLLKAALLEHEKIHAKRQAELAYIFWYLGYELSDGFRWEEEKLGYEAQILYLRRRGVTVNEEWFLTVVLSEFYRGMVSKDEALKWFRYLPNR